MTHLYFVAKLATLYDDRPQRILVASSLLFSCISFGAFIARTAHPKPALTARYSAGFGIVATYSSEHFAVPLFVITVHSNFGWQTLTSSLSAILAVSSIVLFLAVYSTHLSSQDTVISGGMLVHIRSGKYAARDESVLEVLSRYFLEVRQPRYACRPAITPYSAQQTNLLATLVRILSLAFLLAWNADGRQSGVSLVRAVCSIAGTALTSVAPDSGSLVRSAGTVSPLNARFA